MHNLGTHFNELLDNIQPPQERLDAAENLPPKVRDYVKNLKDFKTSAPHTILVGSYAQKLCVSDVKDVDILVSVPGDPEENEPEAKALLQSLKNALDGLPEELGYEGCTEIDINSARRSVHVYFTDEDFHLDIVPCIAPDGFDEILYIPDKGLNEWIKSHPYGLVKYLDELNIAYHHKVKPLGKLLKHFRNVNMTYMRPKSYWLISLLIHQVVDRNIDTTKSIGELFHDLTESIHSKYDHLLWTSNTATPNIQDPMLDHNVSWNWGRHAFEAFMARLSVACDLSEKALNEDNKDEAIAYWQKIFGEEYFPSNIDEAAMKTAQNNWPGNTYLASSGLISQNQTQKKTIEIPKTKFHGQK